MKQGTYKDFQITATGHDGFIIENTSLKLRIAFDPFEVLDAEPVDYIFISHPHFDHCDPHSVRKLLGPKTKIIVPESCLKELTEFSSQISTTDGKTKETLKELTYWAIPAYNIDKFRTPTEVFHPKELGGLGFVIEIDSSNKPGAGKIRFYHAGDTDVTPEIETLKKIDVAFLPISGTFVMTLDEALKAAELIQPKLAIPMHFGKLLGSVGDATRFQNLLRDKVPVMVLSTIEY